jgi:hypothetical protein
MTGEELPVWTPPPTLGGHMEDVILILGQLALALAGFAACTLLLVVICSALSYSVRKIKELGRL